MLQLTSASADSTGLHSAGPCFYSPCRDAIQWLGSEWSATATHPLASASASASMLAEFDHEIVRQVFQIIAQGIQICLRVDAQVRPGLEQQV